MTTDKSNQIPENDQSITEYRWRKRYELWEKEVNDPEKRKHRKKIIDELNNRTLSQLAKSLMTEYADSNSLYLLQAVFEMNQTIWTNDQMEQRLCILDNKGKLDPLRVYEILVGAIGDQSGGEPLDESCEWTIIESIEAELTIEDKRLALVQVVAEAMNSGFEPSW